METLLCCLVCAPFKVRAGLWVKAQEFGGPGVIEAAFEEEKRLREGSWRALYLWGTVALY